MGGEAGSELESKPALLPQGASGAVLAAKLRGYAALAEPLPPQQAAVVLDDYYRRFAEAADASEVTLVTFSGPTALAAWDPTLGRERSAVAAPETARLLVAGQRPPHRGSPVSLSEGIRFGIGIGAGPVFIGTIGPDASVRDAVGDTVNTAVMLAAAAAAGEVLITDAAWRALGNGFGAENAGSLHLNGKRVAVETYRLYLPV
jgi:class 3 adenylate cyclase